MFSQILQESQDIDDIAKWGELQGDFTVEDTTSSEGIAIVTAADSPKHRELPGAERREPAKQVAENGKPREPGSREPTEAQPV